MTSLRASSVCAIFFLIVRFWAHPSLAIKSVFIFIHILTGVCDGAGRVWGGQLGRRRVALWSAAVPLSWDGGSVTIWYLENLNTHKLLLLFFYKITRVSDGSETEDQKHTHSNIYTLTLCCSFAVSDTKTPSSSRFSPSTLRLSLGANRLSGIRGIVCAHTHTHTHTHKTINETMTNRL